MSRTVSSILSVSVLVLSVGLWFWLTNSEGSRTSINAQEIQSGTILVSINDNDFLVELAKTTEQHTEGLSYRDSLKIGTGMLFLFNQPQLVSFWMYKMNFPIDILWIKDGEITGIERSVPHPQTNTKTADLPTYQSPGEIDMVLEINAGEGRDFRVGDKAVVSSSTHI